jgi:hypothetical protein
MPLSNGADQKGIILAYRLTIRPLTGRRAEEAICSYGLTSLRQGHSDAEFRAGVLDSETVVDSVTNLASRYGS